MNTSLSQTPFAQLPSCFSNQVDDFDSNTKLLLKWVEETHPLERKAFLEAFEQEANSALFILNLIFKHTNPDSFPYRSEFGSFFAQLSQIFYQKTGQIPQKCLDCTFGLSLLNPLLEPHFQKIAIQQFCDDIFNRLGLEKMQIFWNYLKAPDVAQKLSEWIDFQTMILKQPLDIPKPIQSTLFNPPLKMIAFALEPHLRLLDARHPNHLSLIEEWSLLQWQLIEKMLEYGAQDFPMHVGIHKHLVEKNRISLFDFFAGQAHKEHYKDSVSLIIRDQIISKHWVAYLRKKLDEKIPQSSQTSSSSEPVFKPRI